MKSPRPMFSQNWAGSRALVWRTASDRVDKDTDRDPESESLEGVSEAPAVKSATDDNHGSHGHVHGASFKGVKSSNRTRWLLAALLAPLVAFATIGAVLLWPSSAHQTTAAFGPATDVVKGRVAQVDRAQCQAETPDAGICMTVTVDISDGPEAGAQAVLSLPEGPGQVSLNAGDAIVMGRTAEGGQVLYYFSDLQRGSGLSILGVAFAIFVVAIARWRGLGALVGLVLTYAIITLFVLPAILDGQSPVFVTLVGSAAIVIVVLYVAHGPNARTTVAIIGTLLSLALVGALAVFSVELANITGLSTEEVSYVQNFAREVNVHGLLLGGIILGALGVLNDMTVSQASSVWEIHRAQPDQSRLQIYRSAMRVGRDHIASTIYTLVLAYTGASLPLLILFTLSDRGLTTVLTTDLVGEEIVRSIVGSFGLMLSVPITTFLAAVVVKGQRSGSDRDSGLAKSGPDPDPPSVVDPLAAPTASSTTFKAAVNPTATDPNPPSDAVGNRLEETAPVAPKPPGAPSRPADRRKPRRWWQRKRPKTFDDRRMSRRERKFWDDE